MDPLPPVHLRLEGLHGKLVAVIIALSTEVAALDDDTVAVQVAVLGATVEVEGLSHLAAEPRSHVHPAIQGVPKSLKSCKHDLPQELSTTSRGSRSRVQYYRSKSTKTLQLHYEYPI